MPHFYILISSGKFYFNVRNSFRTATTTTKKSTKICSSNEFICIRKLKQKLKIKEAKKKEKKEKKRSSRRKEPGELIKNKAKREWTLQSAFCIYAHEAFTIRAEKN